MSRAFRIQTEPYTDQITDDGHELSKLPYPLIADENGMIAGQDFWCGLHHHVIGFQKDLSVQVIDLRWKDALDDLDKAIGMYLVTSDRAGDWGSLWTAVKSVTELNLKDRS